MFKTLQTSLHNLKRLISVTAYDNVIGHKTSYRYKNIGNNNRENVNQNFNFLLGCSLLE